jgi:hypothetical protein
MYFNHVLIDRYLSSRRIPIPVPPIVIGTLMAYTYFKDGNKDYNDLRIKEHGKCHQELVDFGKCLEEHNDQFEPCRDLLEIYKKCLQNH